MAALLRLKFREPFLSEGWLFWLLSCPLRGMVWDCFLAKVYLASKEKWNLLKKKKKGIKGSAIPLTSLLHAQIGRRVLKDFHPGFTICVSVGFWLGGCGQGGGSRARAWAFIRGEGRVVCGAVVRGGKGCRWGEGKAEHRAAAAMLSVGVAEDLLLGGGSWEGSPGTTQLGMFRRGSCNDTLPLWGLQDACGCRSATLPQWKARACVLPGLAQPHMARVRLARKGHGAAGTACAGMQDAADGWVTPRWGAAAPAAGIWGVTGFWGRTCPQHGPFPSLSLCSHDPARALLDCWLLWFFLCWGKIVCLLSFYLPNAPDPCSVGQKYRCHRSVMWGRQEQRFASGFDLELVFSL